MRKYSEEAKRVENEKAYSTARCQGQTCEELTRFMLFHVPIEDAEVVATKTTIEQQ
jgi:hypothetical protein